MSMTRKNYEAAASVIRDEVDLVTTGQDTAYTRTASLVLFDVASGLADMFARDNGAFDRGRFMRAAGVADER